MTTPTPRPCLTPGCDGTPKPEWAWCPPCADKVIASAMRGPVARPNREPEWIRRMRLGRGVAKDYSAA